MPTPRLQKDSVGAYGDMVEPPRGVTGDLTNLLPQPDSPYSRALFVIPAFSYEAV
jgi:hypothetical protein